MLPTVSASNIEGTIERGGKPSKSKKGVNIVPCPPPNIAFINSLTVAIAIIKRKKCMPYIVTSIKSTV